MMLALLLLALLMVAFLATQLKKLRGIVDALTERVAALERKLRRQPESPPAQEKVAIPPSPLLAKSPAPESRPPAVPPPLPVAPLPAPTPATPFNWEAFLGVKLFAWLGGLALFFRRRFSD